MEKSGEIGSSGVNYEVSVDAKLNVVASIKIPLPVLLDQVVAQLKSPVATKIEQALIQAAEAYLAMQAAIAPVAVVAPV